MNAKEGKEMSNKARKKFYRTNRYKYHRNTGYYSGNRNYNFYNNYSNNGITSGSSRTAFHHSRSSRQYQQSKKDSSEYYTDYYWQQPIKVRREPSPLNGSEEYTLRKIQETSDMIKKHLMSPGNIIADSNTSIDCERNDKSPKEMKKLKKNSKEPNAMRRKLVRKAALRKKFKESLPVQKSSDTSYNVKEIHDQIMNHISKLNYGRKQNLINADSTGYDEALQQIYKQKSLELSKALREMSHQEKPEASDIVNSIIPDFAIKFEELPVHVIRELSSTFESIEKDIGNIDITPFNFSNCSTIDHCLFKSNLEKGNSFSQEYLHSSCSYEMASKFNSGDMQGSIDDRVLHLNSEDADSLVIKKENIISGIKTETLETIEIEDDDINEADQQQKACPNSNILQSVSVENIPNIETLAIASSESETVSSSTANPVGFLRVSTSIFEKPNHHTLIHNKSGSELTECCNENQSSSTDISNHLVPKIRINMNIFDKIENFLSEFHSDRQTDNPVEQLLYNENSGNNSLNKATEFQSPNQMKIDEIISFPQHPSNIKLTNSNMSTIEKEILLDSYSNVFRDSNTISSNLSQEQKSTDSRIECFIDTQKELLNHTDGKNIRPINQNLTNLSSVNDSFVENGNLTADDNNGVPLQANAIKTHKDSRCEFDLFQRNLGTDVPNQYFSVTIKQFPKPKNIAEAAKIMLEIDSEIEKLTKLRQSLILNLIGNKNSVGTITEKYNECKRHTGKRKKKKGNSNEHKTKRPKRNNRKNQDVEIICTSSNNNAEVEPVVSFEQYSEARIQLEDNVIDRLEQQLENDSYQNETNQTQNVQNIGQDFRNKINLYVNDLSGVAVICKVVQPENSLIIGTDNGKIQYFNIYTSEKPTTVGIGKNAISCLESTHIGIHRWIFTGTAVDSQLRAIQYKRNSNRKVIQLEDGIQIMQRELQYFFIGGSRGFLTRYNWQKNRIEFEDRISEMTIVDLKVSREGPRRILIILFKDEVGYTQIHVRDAMSALHIRTIGEEQTVNRLLIKDSLLYFSSKQEISIYSFCDGQFITKFNVPAVRSISFLHKWANLLLIVSDDGNIHAYNIKNMNFLDCFPCESISSLVIFQDKIIFGSWSKEVKYLSIPQHILASGTT